MTKSTILTGQETAKRRINDTDLYEHALQAWHEYNPIKEEVYGDTGDDRTEEELKLYRYRTFGKDAAMFMLDTRSFRDENISILGQDAFTLPQQAYARERTILGKKQLNVNGNSVALTSKDLDLARAEIRFSISDLQDATYNFRLANSKGEEFIISYDHAQKQFSMNRSHAGQTGFSDKFAAD